jgi:sec-independent protein translocase protein TatC
MSEKSLVPHTDSEVPQKYSAWDALAGEADETPISIWDHLNELRSRLFRSLIALVIGVLAAAIFTERLLKYLITPYGTELQVLGPTESVVIYFRIALLAGAIVVMPYITFQLFMFIAPGLTRKEKRYIYLALPATTGLFLVGVGFAWFIGMDGRPLYRVSNFPLVLDRRCI